MEFRDNPGNRKWRSRPACPARAIPRRRLKATAADHLEHVSDEGIGAMARAGAQPVLLPAAAYAMGSTRYPRARGMIDAGRPIVFATDFNSSPTFSRQPPTS